LSTILFPKPFWGISVYTAEDILKEIFVNREQGCLTGLFKLLMLDVLFDWLQERFGFGRGASCTGCGCGFILLILFIALSCQVIFNTDWLHLGF
jgi:hypothetical protein